MKNKIKATTVGAILLSIQKLFAPLVLVGVFVGIGCVIFGAVVIYQIVKWSKKDSVSPLRYEISDDTGMAVPNNADNFYWLELTSEWNTIETVARPVPRGATNPIIPAIKFWMEDGKIKLEMFDVSSWTNKAPEYHTIEMITPIVSDNKILIQRSTNNVDWETVVTGLPITGNPSIFIDRNSPATQGFYRARMNP